MATDQPKKILMMGTPFMDEISHLFDCLRWDAVYWGLFSAGVSGTRLFALLVSGCRLP